MDLQIGDKIEVQGKWNQQWYPAVVTGIGFVTGSSYRYVEYKLINPTYALNLFLWKDGVFHEDIDPEWKTIRMLEPIPRKKLYKLAYNTKDFYHYLEEVK